MGWMAARRAPSSPVPSTGRTSQGRGYNGGWQLRRRSPAAVIVTGLATVTMMVACLAVTSWGSPAPSEVDGGDGGGMNEVATPLDPFSRSWSQSTFLSGLASRASGSGPCSSSACISRWKGGFIAALFVEGIVGGIAPQGLRFLSPHWRSRSLHIANAFSGGIFFTTGMLHILPEAIEHLNGEGHGHGEEHEEGEHEEGEHDHEEGEEGHDEEGEGEDSHGFPTGYALATAGFYAILFLEHLVLSRYTHHSHGDAAAGAGTLAAKGLTAPSQESSGADSEAGLAAATTAGAGAGLKASQTDCTTQVEDGDESARANGTVGGALQRGASAVSVGSVDSAATDSSDAYRNSLLEAENVGFFSPNFGRAFLAAFSVAIHVVFESLSLGLASTWSTLFNTFLAIAAHKWATAASLGVKFEKERLRRLQSAVLIVTWSAVTPAAAGIGAIIDGEVGDEVTGVLLALSAGTFLYIGAFEIVAEEFIKHTRDGWIKALATTLGVGVIMAVTGILSSTGVH